MILVIVVPAASLRAIGNAEHTLKQHPRTFTLKQPETGKIPSRTIVAVVADNSTLNALSVGVDLQQAIYPPIEQIKVDAGYGPSA